MQQEELIEPDEIENIHDAVIVNGIDRYSDISEPASPRAAATLDALAAAVVEIFSHVIRHDLTPEMRETVYQSTSSSRQTLPSRRS